MPDVAVTVTLKDAHVQRALDAATARGGKRMELFCADQHPPGIVHSYVVPEKGAMTNKQWAEAITAAMWRAMVREKELNDSFSTHVDALKAVPEATENVPDGIVE